VVLVPVEVSEGFGVGGDHGVEVESLRVGEVGVGDGHRDIGPVGAEPAAEAVGVVARAEVVVAGFGVAFLALKFVIVLCAGVGDGALAAERREVRIVAHDARVVGNDARGAERVFDVILRRAARREQGNTLAAKEDVLVEGVAGGIGLGQDFAARAVPVELAVNLGDAAAIATVGSVMY
jgi:hypothetical protein